MFQAFSPTAEDSYGELGRFESNEITLEKRMREINERILDTKEQIVQNQRRTLAYLDETANNSSIANRRLNTLIDQQSDYISLLKESNSMLHKQLDIQQCQLESLHDIFTSSESSVIAEKEIMQLIAEQLDDKHPLREYIKDKGSDALIAYGPVLVKAFEAFLIARGVTFF